MKVAIVADDLTGAADSGVQFARAGYRSAVAFRGAPIPPAEGLDAVALNTDSRALEADLAAERASEAGRAVRGAEIVYKKVDSTLRGQISAELPAVLVATGRKAAVVCPAFPAAGRTVEDGIMLVHGIPVHQTPLKDDPVTPVREGHLPTLLSDAFGTNVAPLSTNDLRSAGRVREALERSTCLVADATSEADLKVLVGAVADPSEVLWVGSAGLAGALASARPGSQPVAPVEESESPLGTVVVVGSLNEVARGQLRVLLDEPEIVAVPLDVAALLGGPSETVTREATNAARAALLSGSGVVLHSTEGRAAGGVSGAEAARHTAQALAGVVARLSEEGLFGALVLTGGDTAVAVGTVLGASGILLGGELEPGVPVGILIGPRPYRVVTKAGGFGGAGALRDAYRLLADVRKE
jgi:uncharacterized protein YgbK (DUF1537 family)